MKNLKVYEKTGEIEALKAFIFKSKEEFKGDLTEFEVTKYLMRNDIIDSKTSNVNEVVKQFIENEQEKREIFPDDNSNSNSDNNTSISGNTVIDNNTSVSVDTIIDNNTSVSVDTIITCFPFL